ncbi:MAG: hypothetical protein N3G79_03590 [Sulfolobales archaeon]|nr:hypothetical protein [Sulfolobales archaeon]
MLGSSVLSSRQLRELKHAVASAASASRLYISRSSSMWASSMSKRKKRGLPGIVLLLALIISSVALGIYGNKLIATEPRVTETTTETPARTQEPGTAPPSVTNETVTTPTNSTNPT